MGLNHCQAAPNLEEYRLTVLGDASTILRFLGPLAQMAEHLPFKERVAGSSPARLTSLATRVLASPHLLDSAPRTTVAFSLRPVRLARPRTPPFHGGNRGSNPLRDATHSLELTISPLLNAWGLVTSWKRKSPKTPFKRLTASAKYAGLR